MRNPGEPLGYTYGAEVFCFDHLPPNVDPDGEGVYALPPWYECDHNLECDVCGEIVVGANVEAVNG